MFCYCDTKGFGLGADEHFGLYIEENLRRGQTFTCKTYMNDVLSDANHFKIASLEIYGFFDENDMF